MNKSQEILSLFEASSGKTVTVDNIGRLGFPKGQAGNKARAKLTKMNLQKDNRTGWKNLWLISRELEKMGLELKGTYPEFSKHMKPKAADDSPAMDKWRSMFGETK
jgi:hypothetical protein